MGKEGRNDWRGRRRGESERRGEKRETGWAGEKHLLLLPHSCQYLDDLINTTLLSWFLSYVYLSFSPSPFLTFPSFHFFKHLWKAFSAISLLFPFVDEKGDAEEDGERRGKGRGGGWRVEVEFPTASRKPPHARPHHHRRLTTCCICLPPVASSRLDHEMTCFDVYFLFLSLCIEGLLSVIPSFSFIPFSSLPSHVLQLGAFMEESANQQQEQELMKPVALASWPVAHAAIPPADVTCCSSLPWPVACVCSWVPFLTVLVSVFGEFMLVCFFYSLDVCLCLMGLCVLVYLASFRGLWTQWNSGIHHLFVPVTVCTYLCLCVCVCFLLYNFRLVFESLRMLSPVPSVPVPEIL